MRAPRHDLPRVVTVVGAGLIGCSFAAVFARSGCRTKILEKDPVALARGADTVLQMLRETGDESFARDVSLHEDAVVALEGATWVQECVPENLSMKQAVMAELDSLCEPQVLLASSASELLISQIASGLAGAGRCVVVHPTNPPHLIPLVEVVGGPDTKPSIVDRASVVMEALGQVPVRLHREIPGFLLNRLQVALEREAFELLLTDVASVADIDRVITHGLAPRWTALGPFAVEETNSQGIADGLERFAPYFERMFAALTNRLEEITPELVQRAVEGVVDAYGADSRERLIQIRNQRLLEERIRLATSEVSR